MGLSHHSDEYHEMREDFRVFVRSYIGIPNLPDMYYDNMVDQLFSIMNEYGAVEWT